jgi:hypothetical protein
MKTRMGPAKLVGVESPTVGNLRSRHSMRTYVFELAHENTERTINKEDAEMFFDICALEFDSKFSVRL